MANLELQAWQILYRKALAESDPQEMRLLVMATENAIFERSQLIQGLEGEAERQAMGEALCVLRRLSVPQ